MGNSLMYDNGTNVGIGTTSPVTKFTVRFATDQNFGIYDNSGTSTIGGLADLGAARAIAINGSTLALQNSLTTYFYMSGGQIAIGKTTPINATLDVNGNTIITGSLIVTAGITGSLQGTASYALSTNGTTANPDFSPIFMMMGA